MSILDFFKKAKNTSPKAVAKKLARNQISMEPKETASEILTNQSKIGGRPYLPADFVWPTFFDKEADAERPLSFFCQINLAETKAYDRDKLLPKTGMLSFFYDCEAFRWGFDPEDAGAARVFYFENLTDFVPHEIPQALNESYVIPELSLAFATQPSYPMYEELEHHSNIQCEWDDYDDARAELGVKIDEDPEGHKLLGYADIIQNEMLSECERVSRGLYTGTPDYRKDLSNEDEADIWEKAKDWTLLLQLGTIEKDEFEWMFGDCGFLYYYIRKQDLAAKQFDRCWFIVQCS